MTDIKIKSTTDYDKFFALPGNRNINWGHVDKLVRAMEEKDYLASMHPILVNENFEIIDGQHRLEALKALKKPVYYIQGQNLKLEDVQMLNAFSKNWTPHDFALSYAKLGYVNYVIYLDVLSRYKVGKYRIKHEAVLRYMTQSKEHHTEAFRRGQIKVPDENKSRKMLQQYSEVASLLGDDGRGAGKIFGLAFWELLQNPKYNHKTMLHKMRKYADKMGKYVTVQDCLRELESIYNRFTLANDQIKAY